MDDLRERLQAALDGTYTLERELGGGGMSRVFVATEHSLVRQVVVKVLPGEMAGALNVERFRREIRLAASLQQANIVPVFSAGDAGGVAYYIMPYVEGESLRSHLIVKGTLPVAECVAILRDVARALAFAHAAGVVHRDIKPENILLSGGTAVVTDFGVAKAVAASSAEPEAAPLTQAGIVLGTPAYMAPEQVVGEQADHRADIYALGVVAYEMLTGAAPFAGRSAQGMLAAHVLEAPAPITATRVDLPPALVALVMQCLAKERGDRPDSANVVLRALETTSTPSAFVPIGTSQDDQPSIAVLPFENLSPDPADAFFADGLTDEIITDLAAIQALRVIGRSSVSRYRDGGRDPRSVARELGVRHVLEGSVRRAGSSFRLTLRLVDGLTGTTLWSDKLGGQVEDIFAVQETSSRTIVEALRVKLTPQDARRLVDASPRPTFSAEAIDQYLKGRHFFALATADGLANALQCFQRATDLEPDFPAALAGLAATCTFMTLAWQSLPPRETMPRSRAAAQRAIDLDSRLAEAHVALGLVSAFHDWDPRRAESSFRSAIALNANYAEAEYSLVQTLIWLETRFDEGVQHAQRAVAISPLDPWALWYLGLAQYFGRDYEARIETHQRLIALHPHWALGHFGMGATLSTLGRPAEATACHLRAIELDGRWPPHVAWLGVSFALSGRDAEALDCLAELEEQEHRGQSVWAWKLILHAAFGNADEVVRALEQAYEERSSSLIIHLNHPFVDCARENPRFHSLLRRMRLDHLVAYRPRREWRGRDLR